MFAGIEKLNLFARKHAPGARGRVATSDKVINIISMIGPVYPCFGSATPTFIASKILVLDQFMMLAGVDQVRGLKHGCNPHRKQAIEVNRAKCVIV